jgi:hypothetical protein
MNPVMLQEFAQIGAQVALQGRLQSVDESGTVRFKKRVMRRYPEKLGVFCMVRFDQIIA